MNRVLLALCLATLPLVSRAQSTCDSLAGTYRLQVSEEALALARLSGSFAPKSVLRLTNDRHFTLCTETAGGTTMKTGTFSSEGDRLVLSTRDGDLVGFQSGSRLKLEGLAFVREPVPCLNLVGTWCPRRNGSQDRSAKIVFGKDGNFSFSCVGANSAGKWEVQGSKLVLLWTQVDDEKVELGSMRKEIPLSEDGTSFNIDVYHYERSL